MRVLNSRYIANKILIFLSVILITISPALAKEVQSSDTNSQQNVEVQVAKETKALAKDDVEAAAITKVYSKPPLDRKNPLLRCTLIPAVRIKIKSRIAAGLVCTPMISNSPPINTVYEAT